MNACCDGARKIRAAEISPPPGHYGQDVQEKIKTGSADARFCSGSAAHNEQVMKKLVTKCALFAGKRLKPH
jgi:hypothetical protein